MLRKRCYINKLAGTEEEGNKQYAYHIKLKGISEDAINHYITKQQEHNPEYNQWNVYEILFKGESMKFDLNINSKVRFEKGKDQEYGTFTGQFKRTIKCRLDQ